MSFDHNLTESLSEKKPPTFLVTKACHCIGTFLPLRVHGHNSWYENVTVKYLCYQTLFYALCFTGYTCSFNSVKLALGRCERNAGQAERDDMST